MDMEIAILVALLGVGVVWSFSVEVYDVRVPAARVALTLTSFAVTFGLFWAGLVVAKTPRSGRSRAAAWASIPWNSLLLAQIAYIGYLLLPVEVLASVILLRRRSPLSYPAATVLATVTRAAVFLLMMTAAAATRTWLRR